ncbi:MFS general substrate transporter-64 [Coleophoma crateriformis]|uniref:MFS general substrate transporter-64 n=1 Tax=Coleophoma crateriformis TaxID=565419 RepID=A0A3D8SYF9_9HELO|nr:MFS general substrate transporter-64 [Coleophoma crateriformis]
MQPDLEKQDVEEKGSPQDVNGSIEPAGGFTENDGDAEGVHSKEDASIHTRTSVDRIGPVSEKSQSPSHAKTIDSSVHSSQSNVVPRSQRRGLLGRFTIIPEVERPYEYDRKTKWTITLLVALAAAAGPMGSAIFYPALPELSKDLHTSSTITNLTVALYMLSMAIFPLWWSSFSEAFGRRTIYLVSFLLCVVFNILSAISTSIGMLTAMRALSGGASASVQAVGAGSIADLWESKERGKAMGFFYLGPLCGPLIAPIVGGALAQKLGWRSTMWFLTIYAGVLVVTLTFCLPETLHAKAVALPTTVAADDKEIRPQLSRVSTRQSVKMKTRAFAMVLKRGIIDPLSVLSYLRFPVVLLTVYVASITFGCLYVLNISVQQAFSESPYDYSIVIIGLLYIPTSLGYFTASLLGGRWNDYIMHREARKANRYDENGKLILRPEDRVGENAWLAAVMYPGALLWYGWSVDKGLPWIVPAIANFFFGVGSMIIFGTATTMLTGKI